MVNASLSSSVMASRNELQVVCCSYRLSRTFEWLIGFLVVEFIVV